MVVSRHGRYRFQTGMVTASLLQRGLRMADAVEVARAVRDSVAGKPEISTDKLAARVQRVVGKMLGPKVAAHMQLDTTGNLGDVPMVETRQGVFPFSKGVVLRRLDTSGLALEQAMALVDSLERCVRQRAGESCYEEAVSEHVIDEEAARLLHERHGEAYARRYLLARWIRHADKPLILFIGGATGTGKSTLALELASRLGFKWIMSTDMIRETLRTAISSELMPGLHDHSFRGIVMGGQVLSDPRERVLAGFRQQAAQVAVGVRAVVKRAIREGAHIVIEGTHLSPPFRQYLPPGAEVHMAGLILAVPNKRAHKKRFPKRASQQNARAAVTYLDAFQSVRWIHDDLLSLAEDNEAIVLPNVHLQKTLTGAVDFLSRELPVEPGGASALPNPDNAGPDVPTLFLILDGLADVPNPALGNKTPLQAAHTPTLNRLAGSGGQGQIHTGRTDGSIPSTDEGILALLGAPHEVKDIGRGLFEALGQGLPMPRGAVILRGNLATVQDDGTIVDRRAGRPRAGVQDLLADLRTVPLAGGIIGRLFPNHEHRVVVMLQGNGLSHRIADTDPGSDGKLQRQRPATPLDPSPNAKRTAQALQQLLTIARKHLSQHPLNAERIKRGLPPADAVITRGAARAPDRDVANTRSGVMVSGCSTALGIARYVGMQTATSRQMTGNLDTDLDAKFDVAAKLFEEQDFVAVHIKGTDIAAHDRRPLEKRDFIQAIDAALGRFLRNNPDLTDDLRVVVSADHGTSSISGNHLADPVPLLLGSWQHSGDEEQDFDEESASHGALGLLRPGQLSQLLGLERS